LADGRVISENGKRYYTGTVREKAGDERSKEAMARQVKLFNQLKKTNWEIKTSKLRERKEKVVIDSRVVDYKKIQNKGVYEVIYHTFREKGIDVKIATDLIAGALDKKYDSAIIVSSDTDLVPMIDWIRFRLEKKIEYIGFSVPAKVDGEDDVKPTQSLISRSDVQRVLVESDIRKFHKPSQSSIL